MAATRVIGITKVIFGGTDFGTKPGADIELGGFTKEPVFGSGVLAGATHTPVPMKVSCVLVVKSDTDVEKIRNFEGQIDFETDVGIRYSSANAWVSESVKLSQDGLAVTIMGAAAVKV